jgi:D-inositol-3-phosphate glycosyltransferase
VSSVAILSLHTSPLVQPGLGDSGGMNVYVRELSASLAQAGVEVRVYVRRWSEDLPDRVRVEPGLEVVHVDAGPVSLAKEDLPSVVEEFADAVAADLRETPVDVLHANYWLSAVAAHRL